MTDTSQAPATKQDIAMLMEQIGTYYSQTEEKINELKESMATKDDLKELKIELNHETGLKFELLRGDIQAMNDKFSLQDDKIAAHDKHIGTLERKILI